MRKGIFDVLLLWMFLSVASYAQVGGPGTVVVGGGGSGGGGVTGLTSCADGTALADNSLMRADGTAKCQGSEVTVGDVASNLIPVTASTGNALQFTGSTNFPLRVLGNAGSVSILGAYDATIAGLWLGEPSPTQSNYSVSSDGTALYLNAPSASGEIDFFQDNTRQTATLLPAGLTLSGWTKAKVFVQENTGGAGSPDTINAGTSSGVFTNFGATAKNYNALPTALVGLTFTFSVQDSDGMRITAAAGDTIRQGASVTTTGGYIESTTVGSSVTLTAINADEWFVTATSDLGTNSWSFN